jgi:hypothetical protein
MKRFARALVVTLALAILASVIAFVSQKSAVAANGEMVTVVNYPAASPGHCWRQ